MYPPSRRFCDLVMKGGITSGIVYPAAVLELAKEYAFKNIGGTSAGAIAACAAAAAELGRRKQLAFAEDRGEGQLFPSELSGAGFAGLDKVARDLATPGFIVNLFQPARRARPLFRTLLQLISRAPALKKGLSIAVCALRLAAGWIAVTTAVSIGVSAMLAALIGLPVLPTIVTI